MVHPIKNSNVSLPSRQEKKDIKTEVANILKERGNIDILRANNGEIYVLGITESDKEIYIALKDSDLGHYININNPKLSVGARANGKDSIREAIHILNNINISLTSQDKLIVNKVKKLFSKLLK